MARSQHWGHKESRQKQHAAATDVDVVSSGCVLDICPPPEAYYVVMQNSNDGVDARGACKCSGEP